MCSQSLSVTPPPPLLCANDPEFALRNLRGFISEKMELLVFVDFNVLLSEKHVGLIYRKKLITVHWGSLDKNKDLEVENAD